MSQSICRSPIILASGSATRANLLRHAGIVFRTIAPTVDEAAIRASLREEKVDSASAAITLADFKAQSVLSQASGGEIVLAADQLLEFEGEWLEKPLDRDKCRSQLLRLRARQHKLISGAAVYHNQIRCWQYAGVVSLDMRDFSDEFLEEYLQSVDPSVFQSVGGYQLEGLGAQFMRKVEGDYFTVLGLPLLEILQFLRDHGTISR